MKLNELYPSKYLKASDLDGNTTVTIEAVVIESMKTKEGGEEDKPVVVLSDSKPFVLNVTNARAIETMHGDDTDEWAGKQIVLYPAEVSAFGDVTQAIRVRDSKWMQAQRAKTAKPAAAPASNGADSDPTGAMAFAAYCATNKIDTATRNKTLVAVRGNYHAALSNLIDMAAAAVGK